MYSVSISQLKQVMNNENVIDIRDIETLYIITS